LSRHVLWFSALLAAAVTVAACGGPARAPAGSSSSAAASTSTATPASPAAPTAWAALGAVRPLWIARNAPGPVSDPAQPQDLAVCAPGAVKVSRDGGKTWTSVPTGGVVAATAKTPYPVLAQGGAAAPTCTAALADMAHRRAAYAVFAAGPAKYGMPPIYYIPLYTTDGGAHWQVVVPPNNSSAGGFGGFQISGGTVRALFNPTPVVRIVPGAGDAPNTHATTGLASGVTPATDSGASSSDRSTPSSPAGLSFRVTETTDGGASWRAGAMSCPASGPCAAWGPAPSGTGSCAMHPYPQPVLASTDGGKTWSSLPAPAGAPPSLLANGCALNQLAALSLTRLALVANGTATPQDTLRISEDGGRTWSSVALPALPGGGSTQALQMLPDGSLVAPILVQTAPGRYGSHLQLLKPAATAWCTVPNVTLQGSDTDPTTLQAAGGRLWWIQAGTTAPTVQSVPLSAIHC